MAPILISAAVSRELQPLLDRLANPVAATIGRRRMVRGTFAGLALELIATGPGLANTVQALTAAMEHPRSHGGSRQRYRFILQTGCAGAFPQAGPGVGAVAVATEEIDIHSGLEPGDGSPFPAKPPFPLLTDRNPPVYHRYPLDPDLAAAAYAAMGRRMVSDGTAIFKGPFVTTGTITTTRRRAQALFSRYGALMESMEGAAAAHVALHYHIPLLEIRGASNLVGPRDRGTWEIDRACRRAARGIAALLEELPETGTIPCPQPQ